MKLLPLIGVWKSGSRIRVDYKKVQIWKIPFELSEANTHIAFIAANASFLIEKIIEEPAEVTCFIIIQMGYLCVREGFKEGWLFLRIKKLTHNFFLGKRTIDAWNKFYTGSQLKIFIFAFVIAVCICPNKPKSDISGALGPTHCITLKAFAIALGDRTKCKTCFGCPRMVLCGPWKNLFFLLHK